MDKSLFIQFENGRYWHWQISDSARNTIAMSLTPYDEFDELVKSLGDIALLLQTAKHTIDA